MEKTIKVTTAEKDYFKVMGIIKAYANKCIQTALNGDHKEIEFSCSTWRLRRCRHDLNLAMALGIEMVIES